ncbi:MAG TPA: methylmalonyl Co-A mutase-associated GTPase MeaB [Chryseosolibacter sp.]
MNSSRLQTDEYINGVLRGDRGILAKAITLVESTLPGDQRLAGEVLKAILPHAGNSIRIGITGAPGVGKSTFIESFGRMLLDRGKQVAVLTIDPSSQLTQGSILGDKTRMQDLAKDVGAFIRPSPSGSALGGVAASTRETILLCEAAGHDIVIVETVGTGQSEIAIKTMVDFFLLLMLPGSGDELQGIKKGVVEMADAIVITKADGQNATAATTAQADFQHALHLLPNQRSGWMPKVVTASAMQGKGLPAIWSMIEEFKNSLSKTGSFAANRKSQQKAWFKDYFSVLLSADPKRFARVAEEERRLAALVESQGLFPREAARQLLDTYYTAITSGDR